MTKSAALAGLRVCMVSPGFFPAVGGAESQALELGIELVRRGASVEVLTRRFPGSLDDESVRGIPVRRISSDGKGTRNAAAFSLAVILRLIMNARRINAVHVHLAGSPAVAAALAGRVCGIPVIVKIGGGRGIGEIALSSKSAAGRLKLAFLRLLRPRLVAVCSDILAELEEHGLQEEAAVIPNGVDLRKFHPVDGGEKKSLRAEFGWPDGTIFLYTGRFAAEKQLSRFARAFRAAAAQSKAALVLVGTGPEEGPLLALAQEPGAPIIIEAPARDIERRYRAADAFVLPSISEGLSNSLLEAMASGLGAAASSVGGTKDVVKDGVNGFLFSPEDDAAMRSAVSRLLSGGGVLERFGRASRELAEREFSIERTAELYAKLYRGGNLSE